MKLTFLLLLCALVAAVSSFKLIPTPFGLMPQQCVHTVESGVHIRPAVGKSGTEVLHKNGTVLHLPELPECMSWALKMQYERQLARNRTIVSENDQLVGDGWLDNAAFYPPNYASSFSGTYTVPQGPSSRGYQYLYYFLGLENMNTSPLTILQPVLTFSGGYWSVSSWNCCPSGQAHQSNPIYGLSATDTLAGSMTQSGYDWTISSTYNQQNTYLTVASAGRLFNYVDATLETYYVQSCSQLPSGPMTFSDMKLQVSGGQQVTPAWRATGATMCNGRIDIIDSSTLSISHN